MLMEPIQNSTIFHASPFQEDTIINDFSQSCVVTSVLTAKNAAELPVSGNALCGARGLRDGHLDGRMRDLEIRTGFPLLEPFLGSDVHILKQMVEMLRRLPDPW